MIAVGSITKKQATTLEMCADAVKRAQAIIKPGLPFSALHDAAFTRVHRPWLPQSHTSPNRRYALQLGGAMPDGSARLVPEQHVPRSRL
jgi:hypothetical protein